jgi:peptide deformylase
MPILPIKKYPAKILREKAKKIKDPLNPEVVQLIKDMIETLKNAEGLGLAAPQVGKSLRLCIIEEPPETEKGQSTLHILINPKITTYSKEKSKIEEGCLSFPGKFYVVSRPSSVKVRFLDETGKNVKIKADGLLARALQHEIDHLDGILITDKLKNKHSN